MVNCFGVYKSGTGLRDTTGTDEDAITGMYHDGVYYVSLPFARRFAALDARTGHALWSAPTLNPVKMSAVLYGGNLFFGDTGGHFYVVNARDGHLVSDIKFPSIFTCSPPVIVGTALFVANSKRIYAIPVDALVKRLPLPASVCLMDLQVFSTSLRGAVMVVPTAFADDRGLFKETYVRSRYRALGITDEFLQDNVSFSHKGVLRGLHSDPEMSKLVQVLRGEAFDVIVDARKDSPTLGQWNGVHLRADDHTQLYIPAGFLHGFLAMTDDVIFCYKQSAEYAPEREIGVRWDDPDLAISWPMIGSPDVSPKDSHNRSFRELFGASG